MLNPNTVYRKTETGIAEVQARALGLRAELRRLLILIDGTATVGRLSGFVRGAEIDFLIAELETQGLVTSGAGSAAPSVTAASTANSNNAATADGALEPSAAQVQAVRRAAISTLHDILGPGADDLAVKIERCKNSQEVRAAITEVRQALDRMVSQAAGQRFLEAVRSAAENTR
jgi:hypothetical protein